MMEIKNIKEVEFKILKCVTDYCDKQGLAYYLTFGTLLGAIRHGGFIPWDDDVDIAMPREDYRRFVESFYDREYEVLEYSKDEEYPYPFAKVIDKSTVLIEPTINRYPLGVYIDIFPVDGLPDSLRAAEKHIRKAKALSKGLLYKSISLKYPISVKYKLRHLAAKVLLLPVTRKAIVEKQIELAQRYPYALASYICIPTIYAGNKIMEKAWVNHTMEATFEGERFKIPLHYKEYLTKLYGDYMTLPPEQKRTTHHCFKAYWKY